MFQQGKFTIDQDATPEQLARKRAAKSAAINKAPAQYAGAGLAQLATGILGGIKNRKLDKFETEKTGEAQDAFNQALGGMSILGATPFTPTARAPEAVSTSNLDGAAVAGDTMDVLVKQGLERRGMPSHVADAFVMNFKDESNLNPGINEANPIVPGSRGGFGLAQWTGPRRRQLEAFASQQGKPVSDVDVQLDFLMQELQGSERNAAQSIFAAQDSGTAAQAIVNNFLRPAEEHRARRAAQYGGGAAQIASGVNNLQGITEAMSNPWIMKDSGKAAILQSMLGKQLTPPAPQYQQMSGAQLGMTGEAAGNMFNVAPDGKISQIGGGGVTVNNNAAQQPNIGTIPQGYTAIEDPSNPSGFRMEAIPGGPEDSTQSDAATQSARDTASDNVLTAASRARGAAGQRNGPTALPGIVGAINP